MSKILEIQQLSKSYRSVKAVENLSLTIEQGQAYGILGPNGSGKTTTLSVITGILNQDSGSFRWFEESPVSRQRTKIGSLIESPHFYPYLNLERNLKIICEIKQMDYSDIPRVLQETLLYERRKSKFKTLSLGMKQRLGIAASLLGDPEVLVLDEPTNGLDPEGIAEVREMLTKLVDKGKTLILASHILSEVEKVCSHVAILKKGHLLANGSVKELLTEDEVVELSCSENDKLMALLNNSELIREVSREDHRLIASLAAEGSIETINELAFKNKLVLNHIVSRKKSLEAQFLELVKK